MAQHLLSERYKDPAAVVAGSVLEEHLHSAAKHGVDTEFTDAKGSRVPTRASTLNVDLSKAGVYSRINQQNVTAWLAQRNKAAHRQYSEYAAENVDLMIQGIMNLMAAFPP